MKILNKNGDKIETKFKSEKLQVKGMIFEYMFRDTKGITHNIADSESTIDTFFFRKQKFFNKINAAFDTIEDPELKAIITDKLKLQNTLYIVLRVQRFKNHHLAERGFTRKEAKKEYDFFKKVQSKKGKSVGNFERLEKAKLDNDLQKFNQVHLGDSIYGIDSLNTYDLSKPFIYKRINKKFMMKEFITPYMLRLFLILEAVRIKDRMGTKKMNAEEIYSVIHRVFSALTFFGHDDVPLPIPPNEKAIEKNLFNYKISNGVDKNLPPDIKTYCGFK